MTQKPAGKKNDVLGALSDFVILVLLLAASGFGGYYWAMQQRLAPVHGVPAGTPGAWADTKPSVPPKDATALDLQSDSSASGKSQKSSTASAASPVGENTEARVSKKKYWITSSGAEYMGSSITVKVNDTPVDNFFGPGKICDVTRLVNSGDNTVVFEAKALGADYNKHAGDTKAVLTVQLVHGPAIQESFKKTDVLTSYQRNAANSEDASETYHFNGD